MKHLVYLFNPDNDLALAHGGGHYVAPPFAQKMQADLATLPLWYAAPGSLVLVPNERCKQWVDHVATRLGLHIGAITPDELPTLSEETEFMPWGWSGTIKQRLVKMGVKAKVLPSDAQMQHVRMLAHRRNTIAMHEHIAARTTLPLSPAPVEGKTIEEVSAFALSHPGCYVKMPWSGSGQGVYHAIEPATAEFERWCKGGLKRQGSLMCEVGLQRTMDFALEYKCEGGKAEFMGFSIFESDFHSQYKAGIVAAKAHLHQAIKERYPHIDEIIALTTEAVSKIFAPDYHGFLGVDMLLFDHEGTTCIDPCVEVNLRATMGLVTCMVGENMMPEERTGKFRIEYSKSGFPAEQENRLYLTPIFADTQYCAYVEMD